MNELSTEVVDAIRAQLDAAFRDPESTEGLSHGERVVVEAALRRSIEDTLLHALALYDGTLPLTPRQVAIAVHRSRRADLLRLLDQLDASLAPFIAPGNANERLQRVSANLRTLLTSADDAIGISHTFQATLQIGVEQLQTALPEALAERPAAG